MSTERETLVLLDAHAIIHRAYHALPDFSSSTGEPTGALFGLCNMLFKILDELKPTYIVACYDLPQPTHRHDVYDKYKATRKKGDEALVQQLISSRDVFAAFGIPMYDCPGYEADDVLGTIVREVREMKHLRTIIASGDMDTMQLITDDSVLVYTLRKGIQDTVLYDQKAVEARFGFSPQAIPDYKGFAGDTSDNIPGIKGIGEKTATQLIQLFGGVDGVYKALAGDSQVLVKHGFKPKANQLITAGEEEAQFSKMLATIRTDAPIAFTMPAVYDIKDAAPHILSLCEHYEFRSLVQKVSRLAGVSLAPKLEQRVAVEESPERTQRALIALWLLQSDRTNPTIDDVLRFAKRETVAEAYSVLEQLIGERGLTFVFNDIEVPLAPVVQRMNAAGVLLDLELLKKLSVEYHTELSAIEASIYDLAGKTFNVNSPKQLGEVLYDDIGIKPVGRARTPTGARSTKEADLVKVLDAHPVVQKVLDYRELQKLLSTYIDTLPEMVDGEGRLHTTFQQMGTTTGRLSSVEPNLQNIPIKTAYGRRIREAFVPPAGKCQHPFTV
jgi:DNA polymerase-1